MSIPDNYFIFFDVFIIAVFVVCFITSYKNGIIYELISLFSIIISIFIGYFLSPIFAKRFILISPNFSEEFLINTNLINFSINIIAWFFVITVFFILLFVLIKPIFKKITKIPIVGWVNRLFGLIFGFIKGLILCSLIISILKTSVISNYSDIKDKTIIKYVDVFSNKTIKFLVNNIDYKQLDNSISEIDISETRKLFEDWLIEKGIMNE